MKNQKMTSFLFMPKTTIERYPSIAHDVLIHIVRINPQEKRFSALTPISQMSSIEQLKQNSIEYFGFDLPNSNPNYLLKSYIEDIIVKIVKNLKSKKNRIKALNMYQFEHSSASLRDEADWTKDNKAKVLKIIKKDPWALEFASDRLKNDFDIVKQAVLLSGATLQFASEELKNNREIVSIAVSQNGWKAGSQGIPDIILALQYASHALRNNYDIVFQAVKKRGDALQFASLEMKNNKEIVFAAVKNIGWALQYASELLRADTLIVQEAACKHGSAVKFALGPAIYNVDIFFEIIKNNKNYFNGANEAIEHAPVAIKNDRDVLLNLSKTGYSLNFSTIDVKYKRDAEFLIEVAKSSQGAYEFADPNLQCDRNFLLPLLTNSKSAIKVDINTYKHDKEIMLQLIRLDAECIIYLPNDLKSDRDYILKAVQLNCHSFKYISYLYKNDEEIVKEALKQDGMLLGIADESFWDNREMVLAAVQNNGSAIQYASEDLKMDNALIIEAVKSEPNCLHYIPPSVWSDLDFLIHIIVSYGWEQIPGRKFKSGMLNRKDLDINTKKWQNLLRFFKGIAPCIKQVLPSEKLYHDKDVIVLFLQLGYTVELNSPDLRNDPIFILECVSISGKMLAYASDELKKDPRIVSTAIHQSSLSVVYASPVLKEDISFVIGFIRRKKGKKILIDWSFLYHLSLDLQQKIAELLQSEI